MVKRGERNGKRERERSEKCPFNFNDTDPWGWSQILVNVSITSDRCVSTSAISTPMTAAH